MTIDSTDGNAYILDKQYRTIKRVEADIRDNHWDNIKKEIEAQRNLKEADTGNTEEGKTEAKKRKSKKKSDGVRGSYIRGKKVEGNIVLEKNDNENQVTFIRYNLTAMQAALIMKDIEVIKYLSRERNFKILGDVQIRTTYLSDDEVITIKNVIPRNSFEDIFSCIGAEYIIKIALEELLGYVLWRQKEEEFNKELLLMMAQEYRGLQEDVFSDYKRCYQERIVKSINCLIYDDYKSTAIEALRKYASQIYEDIVKNVSCMQYMDCPYELVKDGFIRGGI